MFLIRKGSKHYHLWHNNNTVCKMWSTGGMNHQKKWFIVEEVSGRLLCTMCRNNQKKTLLPI